MRAASRKATALFGLSVFAAIAMGAAPGLGQETIFGYGDCAWRWKIYPSALNPPPGYSSVSFDDSDFLVGCGPFAHPTYGCGAVGTDWSGEGVLIMRRTIVSHSVTPALVRCEVTSKFGWDLFLNGQHFGNGSGNNYCPPEVGPLSQFYLQPGANVVTLRAFSGGLSYDPWWLGGHIDARLFALETTEVRRQTFGRLKLLYR